jgi:hypothetical protein
MQTTQQSINYVSSTDASVVTEKQTAWLCTLTNTMTYTYHTYSLIYNSWINETSSVLGVLHRLWYQEKKLRFLSAGKSFYQYRKCEQAFILFITQGSSFIF